MPTGTDHAVVQLTRWYERIAQDAVDVNTDEMKRGGIHQGRIDTMNVSVRAAAMRAAEQTFQELWASGAVDNPDALVAFLNKEVADA